MQQIKNQKVKVEKIYKSFLTNAKFWISELDYYGPNQFKQQVNGEGWTIGQLYDHLVNGTTHFELWQIENCRLHVHGAAQGKKTLRGELTYFFGKYPDFRIQGLPESEYVPSQPESPQKMKDDFYRFLKTIQKVSRDLETAETNYKTQHFYLGMLNAVEWFKEIDMHFRHHLIQKRRLDKTLRGEFKFTPGEGVYSEI